jgi:hypothetical protein
MPEPFLGVWFWLWMVNVPWLNRIAWGKLIEPYFKKEA